jgi:putative SOS response-associated peptidase YedK
VVVEKEGEGSPATFNARAETVAEKPMFREAFSPGA